LPQPLYNTTNLFNWLKYTYQLKHYIKLSLILAALAIGAISILYTTKLANQLKTEEVKKVEIWAQATTAIIDPDVSAEDVGFYAKIITDNTTIPVILVRQDGSIEARNLDSSVLCNPEKIQKKLASMKAKGHDPIVINLGDGEIQKVYYDDSVLLQKLKYYPIYQLAIVGIFLLIAYFAFSYARKSEQNKVWVGLAKETAHQLGTPMSSLLAWITLMEEDKSNANELAFSEMKKDMDRLHIITERFSKIGSEPILKPQGINEALQLSIDYLKSRVSPQINFQILFLVDEEMINVNMPLFSWVIENLVKNAIDATPHSKGKINIKLTKIKQHICIDIKDQGKGILSSKFKTIFKPGYTTKKRGWGLGLSLVKRIIEEYHSGRIFVKESQLNMGTTFRIILPKSKML